MGGRPLRRTLRAHWALLAVLMVLLLLFLLLSGLVNGQVGESVHNPSSQVQAGRCRRPFGLAAPLSTWLIRNRPVAGLLTATSF